MGKYNIIKYGILLWIILDLITIPVASLSLEPENIIRQSIGLKHNFIGKWGRVIPTQNTENRLDLIKQALDKNPYIYPISYKIINLQSSQGSLSHNLPMFNSRFILIAWSFFVVSLLSLSLFIKTNKKSQVTLFIILGIVLVLGISMFFFIKSQQIVEKREIIEPVIEKVPTQYQPIKLFIESCISKVTVSGLKILGRQGGYINLQDYNIQSTSIPTGGNAFNLFPNDPNTAVPYWRYFKSSNTCTTGCSCGSEMPNIYKDQGEPSIEGQLEDYIISQLPICFNNFSVFEKQGFEISQSGEVESDVGIRDNDVQVLVQYPITVKKDETETKMEQFYVTQSLKLKKMYELAEGITKAEQNWTYLERWTLEQISAFGFGLDESQLPPTAAFSFDPAKPPVIWTKDDAKKILVNWILPFYTPLFQVYNSFNYEERDDHFQLTTLPIVSPTNSSYNDLEINFEYLNWWNIYFDITGRGVRGNLIGPETTGAFKFFEWLGFNRYNFFYDVSYPVKIDIYDKDAFNEQGYHFVFALEVNVRDNEPINCSGPGIGLVTMPTGSAICTHSCANITIETVNAKNNSALEKVTINYGAGAEMCQIGQTELDGSGKAILNASLPQCVGEGCILVPRKYTFLNSPESYTVLCDTQGSVCTDDNVLCDGENITIRLEPYRVKNITVMKKRVKKVIDENGTVDWRFFETESPLLDNEIAMISFNKIKSSPSEEDFTAMVTYNGSQESAEISPGFVPGDYEVTINLFYNLPDIQGRTEIKFEEKEICVEPRVLGGCRRYENYTIDPFEESFLEGGAMFNWTLDAIDLDTSDKIVFFAISVPDSSNFNPDPDYDLLFDDVQQIGRAEDLSSDSSIRASIEPRFE